MRRGKWDRLRILLGLPRSFTIDGVKYREVSGEPLARALSRRGSRSKEYTVMFPGGRRMRITVTPDRWYADLNGAAYMDEYRLAEPILRPGMRVLALQAGSGYAGAWLSSRVGPSGSVVALDRDPEVIRYARWRYRLDNVAFEVGDHRALAGELDGSFGAIVAVRALHNEDGLAPLPELWRVLAAGGAILIVAPQAGTAEGPVGLERLRDLPGGEVIPLESAGVAATMVRKLAE